MRTNRKLILIQKTARHRTSGKRGKEMKNFIEILRKKKDGTTTCSLLSVSDIVSVIPNEDGSTFIELRQNKKPNVPLGINAENSFFEVKEKIAEAVQ